MPTKTFQQLDADTHDKVWDTYVSSRSAENADDNSAEVSVISDYDSATAERSVLTRWGEIFGLAASQVPPGSIITAVELDLYVNTEGQGLGVWPARQHWKDTESLSTLSQEGANGVRTPLAYGVDDNIFDGIFAELKVAEVLGITEHMGFLNPGNGFVGDINIPLTAFAVAWFQALSNFTSSNYGLVFNSYTASGIAEPLGPGDGQQTDSSEGATEARRPRLTITYDAPPTTELVDRFTFATAVSQGDYDQFGNSGYDEPSGLAASITNTNKFWVNSDGDQNYAMLINADGTTNGIWTFTGHSPVAADDMESIAITERDSQVWVYACYTGNNSESGQTTVKLLRFKEPTATGSDGNIAAEDYEIITIDYGAVGQKDVECVFIDPTDNALYAVTKRDVSTGPRLMRLQWQDTYSGTQTLEDLGLIYEIPQGTGGEPQVGNVVSGTISPDGREVILKSYRKMWMFFRPTTDAMTISELLRNDPVEIEYGGFGSHASGTAEPQGEAVCFDRDGGAIYTLSESGTGTASDNFPFYKYARDTPPAAGSSEGGAGTAASAFANRVIFIVTDPDDALEILDGGQI